MERLSEERLGLLQENYVKDLGVISDIRSKPHDLTDVQFHLRTDRAISYIWRL